MEYVQKEIIVIIVITLKIFHVNILLSLENVVKKNAGKFYHNIILFYLLLNLFRFSHENISKHEIKKFIRDNKQFILELRGKNGKTKIDNEINEYLRNKNKNRNKITNKSFDIMNNMNNNLNCQMINNSLNSLIAMNYLLLQNHFILLTKFSMQIS